MILYCDTSALIKLYLNEAESELMLAEAKAASVLAVCRITWAEAMAALARRAREVEVDSAVIEQARQRLQAHWVRFAFVEVNQALVELAGEHADTFALRGYDSVQLAAVCVLQAQAQEVVHFACFDQRLRKAAKVLGMPTVAD